MKQPFKADIKAIQKRAQEKIHQGALIGKREAAVEQLIPLLNDLLAAEIVCVLRYKNHHYMAEGINAPQVAAEFLQHATEEQAHADLICTRIVQLGGMPNLNPEGLATRSHAKYTDGSRDLAQMIKENLIAERFVIELYSEVIEWIGNDDPTTRRMIEQIMADEEEHADDLASLLATI